VRGFSSVFKKHGLDFGQVFRKSNNSNMFTSLHLTSRKRISHERTLVRLLLCLAVLTGCSGRVTPVDVGAATTALELSLESWKLGKNPVDLLDESPPITVHEIEWSKGAKLLDFEIVSDEKNADQSLIAWVKLKIESANGRVSETTAKYIVNTSPELTVLRMMTRT
jgi:hypothetical protein